MGRSKFSLVEQNSKEMSKLLFAFILCCLAVVWADTLAENDEVIVMGQDSLDNSMVKREALPAARRKRNRKGGKRKAEKRKAGKRKGNKRKKSKDKRKVKQKDLTIKKIKKKKKKKKKKRGGKKKKKKKKKS